MQEQEKRDTKKKYPSQLKHSRLLLKLALLNFIAVLAISTASFSLYTNRIRQDRIKTATTTSLIVSHFLSGDKVKNWIENGIDEEYKITETNLQTIHNNTANLLYLYVYQIRPEGCFVVFDVDTPELEGSEFGEVIEFDESFQPYLSQLLSGKNINVIESRDKYGWLLTDYEPIVDSSGETVAYVGADISMSEVLSDYLSFIKFVAIIAILSLIICIYISSKLSINYYNSEKMEQLKKQQRIGKLFIKELVESFAKVIDLKDRYTNGHSTRVAQYTALLAQELGYSEDEVEKFYNIALLHDVGKIGIPDEILNKPDKLTPEEYEIMKSHTTRGYEVLKNISLMPDISDGARYHHERPDGRGYPEGLKQNEIPRVAQIIAVADTFDAMYSTRKYRKQMNFEKAVNIINEASGTQLTPDVVDAFLKLVKEGKIHKMDEDTKTIN